jgi:cytochrome c oxidase cbb3-type subunit 3
MTDQVERDTVTGQRTTGHEWDGIKELNTPLPKWWLYVLYATIVWSIGYWILYPAWPSFSSYTAGLLGYSTRASYEEQAAAATAARQVWVDRLREASLQQIAADPELLQYAMAGGRSVFAENCAACHGAGGQGAPGYPVLADDSWLWGGTLEAIHQTIQYGIRSGDPDSRVSEMPRFGADALLARPQINDVAEYVLSLTGRATDAAAADRGKAVFAEQCVACHGASGEGNPELGAPALSDGIWQYGDSKQAIIAQIDRPRQGVMPAWQGRLDPVAMKMLAVYVHSLGGGQ